ncbi:MAG: type II toxin-antitoxin system VapC family toxin [Chloroflexi bacterium]|nr:type II toxin-antitoxin system VapC family toxin [Chloroflexota bacterium]
MTTSLVIDANLTFRYLLPGEAHEQLRPLFHQWEAQGVTLIAPTLWAYETASIISKTVHFGHLTEAEGEALLQMAGAFTVQLIPPDGELLSRAYTWTRRLNQAAAYDSFYLALAERLNCDFWTADLRLANAARQPWIKSPTF